MCPEHIDEYTEAIDSLSVGRDPQGGQEGEGDMRLWRVLLVGDQDAGKSTLASAPVAEWNAGHTGLRQVMPFIFAHFRHALFADTVAHSDGRALVDTDTGTAFVCFTSEAFFFWLSEVTDALAEEAGEADVAAATARALAPFATAPIPPFCAVRLLEMGGHHLDALRGDRDVAGPAAQQALRNSAALLRMRCQSLAYFVNVAHALVPGSGGHVALATDAWTATLARLCYLGSVVPPGTPLQLVFSRVPHLDGASVCVGTATCECVRTLWDPLGLSPSPGHTPVSLLTAALAEHAPSLGNLSLLSLPLQPTLLTPDGSLDGGEIAMTLGRLLLGGNADQSLGLAEDAAAMVVAAADAVCPDTMTVDSFADWLEDGDDVVHRSSAPPQVLVRLFEQTAASLVARGVLVPAGTETRDAEPGELMITAEGLAIPAVPAHRMAVRFPRTPEVADALRRHALGAQTDSAPDTTVTLVPRSVADAALAAAHAAGANDEVELVHRWTLVDG